MSSSSILSVLFLGLLGSTVAIGPAKVNLGGAGTFAILATSGVSTIPASSINCDVGVSPIAATAVTGFSLTKDPGGMFAKSTQVTGKVYAASYGGPTAVKLSTAVANMRTAYNDAQGRTNPNFNNLRNGALGGATLKPGLYKFTTGVTIGSDVTLTGGSSDTYIIQSAGPLLLTTGAKVLLSGGIQPANVFWAVGGAVTTASNSQFQGILLAKTNVAVGTNARVNGRILAQTAVTLQKSTVAVPGSCAA